MKIQQTLSILSLAVLTAAGSGCNGSTPTEPVFDEAQVVEESSTATAASSVTGDLAGKRRGADDPPGDDRGGRGRGSDDGGQASRGRGRGGRGGGNPTPTNPTQQPPRQGQQFESAVTRVSGNTLTLANGARVTVNAQTQWNARGDLRSVGQVANAVRAGRPTRVEGRGTRQANGVIVASTIKAEVDD